LRRRPEHLAHRPVELPQAAEARCERDVGRGEVGVVQQAAGEVRATGPGELVGRDAEVLL
jgi:hypothetical protein